ncbi:MAG: hypothetical protein VX335_01770 [Pseudomonadota bacterium]|nr:hypothetical protein [Pseudomonadota bacterium]
MRELFFGSPEYLWLRLLQEAQLDLGLSLGEEVESYVLFTIIQYIERTNIGSEALGVAYLQAQLCYANDRLPLKNVADTCLLMSGLYPLNSVRRKVSPDYFANLGVSSYFQLSDLSWRKDTPESSYYGDLAINFYDVIRVLFYIRCLNTENLDASSLVGSCNGSYDHVIQVLQSQKM